MKNKSALHGFILPAVLIVCVFVGAIVAEITRQKTGQKDFELVLFAPVVNYTFANGKLLNVDLAHAVDSGIVAPVLGQTPSGYFKFTFKVFVNKPGKYYYKIYYQNEDYKIAETKDGQYDTLAAENFYGSWENTNVTFKPFEAKTKGLITVTDSFRIVGNPRNEEKFFGVSMDKFRIAQTDIKNMINFISTQPKWMEYIKSESAKKGITEEDQMLADAVWTLKEQRNKGNFNHRWKRNPRMGNYSATLVVASEKTVNELPVYITDISKKGPKGYYVSPAYYYTKSDGRSKEGLSIKTVNNFIKLKATLSPKKGVYVEKYDYPGTPDSTFYSADCGCDDKLFHTADFEQSFHGLNKDFVLNTIPVSADVAKDEYTREDYIKAEKKYKPTDFVKNYIRITDSPCKTVLAKGNYIELHNPGNPDPYKARKENVGVRTRHGFSYGKITAKVKFPPLINSTNVWTGITQAVWLLYQDKEQWNFRRNAVKGYTPKGSHTADAPRIPSTYYTEIDFEVVKTSKYWPQPDWMKPRENAQETDDIIVTTTNWDLANPDPPKYGAGMHRIPYQNNMFEANRWDLYYQALTIRKAIKHAEINEKDFYYYQIEWKPNEIIWRIGPSKDKMQVVGYMNDKITSIPNNQMIMIITQEYHLSDWWPPIPFKQEFIPFNKTDMVGKVYEVEVE